ncbi:tetranectin-like isoform X1 [Branchiostoma lanceolatum]|uniref:tetranectin-like isoform X1 n=1 Tax=Branchiostoma lanceolatum TaxID=7740 RepID=UPI0034543405
MDRSIYEEACAVSRDPSRPGLAPGPSGDAGLIQTAKDLSVSSQISGQEAQFSSDTPAADVINGYTQGVGVRSPGQSGVLTSAMLQAMPVLTTTVLNCCLLGTVIFLAVTVSDLRLSVSQLDKKMSADLTDLSLAVSQLDQKTRADLLDLTQSVSQLDRKTSTDHTIVSAQPSQALGSAEYLPEILGDKSTISTLLPATCPDGYMKYREVCYRAFDTYKTFSESVETCRADGGTLAMPRDPGINAFLYSLTTTLGSNDDFWFGLHDQRHEGKWKWMDDTVLATGNYSAWAADQPNSFTGEEDCALLHTGWYDHDCQTEEGFICQVRP